MLLSDSLYGEIELDAEIYDLMRCPLVQRLRYIRLSNIDSLSMPGIANISRYEHSIGVAYLASKVGFSHLLPRNDKLVIEAAGLIHDTAITPFGHLAEEALRYVSSDYDHEAKWSLLLGPESSDELGGVDLQLYLGRESGLRRWAYRTFERDAEHYLEKIFDAVKGTGDYGKCIATDIDLDNLDNVTRIAHHMGIEVDHNLPLLIASKMVQFTMNREIIFSDDSIDLIEQWLQLREKVYNRLMLSRDDFCGKAMLLFASVSAYEKGYIAPSDWILTDQEFMARLLSIKDNDISKSVERWMLYDLWSLSELVWMHGKPPDFRQIYSFSEEISRMIGRTCFAYRIKDKRTRSLSLHLSSGKQVILGKDPSMWLLGVASPVRRNFSSDENNRIAEIASTFFSTIYLGTSTLIKRHASLFDMG